MKYFVLFFKNKKIGFDISCILSPVGVETVCMNCQSLFSGKKMKHNIKLLPAQFANGVVKVHPYVFSCLI